MKNLVLTHFEIFPADNADLFADSTDIFLTVSFHQCYLRAVLSALICGKLYFQIQSLQIIQSLFFSDRQNSTPGYSC